MADETAPLYDATDAVAENNARRDVERQARDDADVIRAIMHNKKGRAFILRQLERCYVNSPAKFVMDKPDATAHNLGRESYGLVLLRDVMNASVDLYMTAIKESIEETRRTEEVRRSEEKRRQEAEQPLAAEQMVSALPPPPGFPGHKPSNPPPKTRR